MSKATNVPSFTRTAPPGPRARLFAGKLRQPRAGVPEFLFGTTPFIAPRVQVYSRRVE